MAEQSLEDIIAGAEPEVETTDETSEQPEESVETEETETSSEAETTAADESEKEEWTLAAVKDERRKRQELERQLEELKAQREKAPLPDVLEDQDGYTEALRGEFQQSIAAMRVQLSQEFMRSTKPDYDEKEATFMELAKDNPLLVGELQKSANPALYVYETVRKHEELQKLGDVDSIKAQLRAEIMAELQAEAEGKAAKTAEKDAALKPSMARIESETVTDAEVEEGLDDILGRDANNRSKRK